jgi:adenylate cyclase
MISLPLRRKIMGIAIVLIVLMAVSALLSMASAIQVGYQLRELARMGSDEQHEMHCIRDP